MDTRQIINENFINELLEKSKNVSKDKIENIIEKSKDCLGLTFEEAAILLQVEEDGLLNSMFHAAKEIKEKIYGNRIVVFAPLYTSNECTNNCLYCGFRAENKGLHRKTLSIKEVINEAKAIENQGHKRILLVCGEDERKTDINHIVNSVKAIYDNTDIRRINVNAAPMIVEDFKKLKDVGIGTYQIFQETYHRETYKKMHPMGSKSNYDWRLTALNRAFEAGIDDLGIGVLLGLYDYKFDVLATLIHSDYLDNKYNVGPHTISIPRLRPAHNSALKEVPYPVSEKDLRKIVAVYRLAVPYTGIILSTRESAKFRDELLELGVSQISAGSKTNPGGYEEDNREATQFETSDERSVDHMLQIVVRQGHLPSFCTACYRAKRTGEAFMELAKDAHIHEFCHPNAILTFKEYLLDYASGKTKEEGEKLLEKELNKIVDKKIKEETIKRLERLEKGERDLYF
ncbi:[FeFe] hydrogenase H-cluster radical SAM maturase HydG [Paramaledivibacter caminithermalis]|jgi:2-iminoacetate synthase|uniref:Iron-only hydrogenase maturation protein HydG n=1 Tax=Paramaledivibacter caminithermalis (strain DSM 15212 / CIP 107654 / DViRD3) TaxID=1121301 RepID=A0A1M6KVQ6_PARC5|nr:[FeFe] hydrogenase H-cluster radical SAM maturase HydG [Paramaledivibacter caminithermalis]SHJ63057.1 iron-only hydrogenase maturation protein HydG [Paramaledivibacter caminithermalis DSM 15212]